MGDSILPGHYRAVLLEDECITYRTEDVRKALKLKAKNVAIALSNANIIYAVRSS